MKTLNVAISDLEFNQFGLQKESLTFTEFLDIISREMLKQTLSKSLELAKKYNLSKLSIDDISEEVKAVRDAKSNI
jgi:hypothetical protein